MSAHVPEHLRLDVTGDKVGRVAALRGDPGGEFADSLDALAQRVPQELVRDLWLGRVEHHVEKHWGVASHRQVARAQFLESLLQRPDARSVGGGVPRGAVRVVAEDQRVIQGRGDEFPVGLLHGLDRRLARRSVVLSVVRLLLFRFWLHR